MDNQHLYFLNIKDSDGLLNYFHAADENNDGVISRIEFKSNHL